MSTDYLPPRWTWRAPGDGHVLAGGRHPLAPWCALDCPMCWVDDFFEDVDDVCRGCGCTDSEACPGGCYWIESDLCSSCVRPVENVPIGGGLL